jgi:hypothetical protein
MAAGARIDPLSEREASTEALDAARYITEMVSQLEPMATAANLDLVAYFLGMARSESELFVKGNPETGARANGAAPDDGVATSPSDD